LVNDGLLGIVWKTDGGLLVVRGVAEINVRVGRIRKGCWQRQGNGIPVDARRWYGGGSSGSKQGTYELSAVQGHAFSSRNPNYSMRLMRSLSESQQVGLEINHFTILFEREMTKTMIDIHKIEAFRGDWKAFV